MDLEKIKNSLMLFAKERDWEKFHTPKNLSMALNVEAGELLEIFQWLSSKESNEIMSTNKSEAVKDEIADVFLYTLRLAQILEIDLEKVALNKIEKNTKKYPADLVRGKSEKYSEY